MDVKVSFEKVYWSFEFYFNDDNLKELFVVMLCFVVFNYIECKSLKFLKILLRVIEELKGCDDIVIMKFDKGFGVVVLDKIEYL